MTRQTECAARAQRALEAYDIDAAHEDALRDLLADLRHYCDKHELDFAFHDRVAYRNYLEELK